MSELDPHWFGGGQVGMITTILTVTHIFPAIFVSLPTILEHLPLTCQTLCELLKIYPFNPIYVSIITYLLIWLLPVLTAAVLVLLTHANPGLSPGHPLLLHLSCVWFQTRFVVVLQKCSFCFCSRPFALAELFVQKFFSQISAWVDWFSLDSYSKLPFWFKSFLAPVSKIAPVLTLPCCPTLL